MSHINDINAFLEKQPDSVTKNVTPISRKDHGQRFMLHVTPTKVKQYIPMMPRSSAGSENASVPRITVSDNLMGCFIGYTQVIPDIYSGQLYLGLDYKNGYYIYGLDWEYSLKPNKKLVYDANYSNEHWLVTYNKETVQYTPTLLGKIIPTEFKIIPRSDRLEDKYEITFYMEITEDVEFFLDSSSKVKKGYWKIIADMSRYGLPGKLWEKAKNLSYKETNNFILTEVSKGEYQAKKAGVAAQLSMEGHKDVQDIGELSLESTQILYPIYYRMYGNRRVQNLASPRIVAVQNLPRNSLVHYLSNDDQLDLDSSKVYLQGYIKRTVLEFPTELTSSYGNPRPRPLIVRNVVRDWLNQNRQYKYVPDLYKNTTDQLNLIVFNYNYLKEKYRYVQMPLTDFFKWKNQNQTLWDTIGKLTTELDRNHFFFTKVPDTIPGIAMLRLYEERVNNSLVKVFDSPEKLFLLEIWKFLNPEKRNLSFFKNIPLDKLNKVNIVFELKDGRSAILNLGYLNSWIKEQPNSTEFKEVMQFKYEIVQKLFLKFLLTLAAASPEQTVEDFIEESSEDTEGSTQDELDTDEELDDDDDDDEVHETSTDLLKSSKPTDSKVELPTETDQSTIPLSETELDTLEDLDDVSIQKSLSTIDEELTVLDRLTKSALAKKGVVIDASGEVLQDDIVDILAEPTSLEDIKSVYLEAHKPIETLRQQVDELVDEGNLKASDYRIAVRDIENYIGMPDPYGSEQSVIEASIIKPEELEIRPEETALADNDTVFDKTMLSSSLKTYTKKYVQKNLKKDILGMVGSLQKAGVVIRKHEVDVVESILGAYEHHTLEVKPIDGTASRIHFRIPVINEDGSFLSSGVKYSLRKQRKDVNFRKIKPNIVSISSYYGKTFVTTGEKKANSSLDWLCRQIESGSMSDDNKHITLSAPANVFNNYLESPYIYASLSSRFKLIKAGNLTLNFDYRNRTEYASEEILQKYEIKTKKGYSRISVGITDQKEPIFIDKDNIFHVLKKDGLVELGSIYDILELDSSKLPLDFSEMKVFGKSVPVGVYLGYQMGLGKLIKLLGVTPRVIEPKRNKNLKPDEYAITFKDATYVFSRKDRLASMILGGFTQYEKVMKNYDTTDFNHKDVYLNLLSSKGLGAIYIREMDLMNQLFVDSITESTLRSMGEPTTLNGLLVKASHMLLSYQHPDSQDMDYSTVVGYERIAGAVYKELSTAIRKFKSKNISGRSKIDISPYEVWKNIMDDPALKIVEDINPIQNLKEAEVITYVGEGGRSKDGINKESRAYHLSDIGVVSEATVDSTEVGVNAYLSANPKLANTRGIVDKSSGVDITNMVSTSMLLSPGSNHDDQSVY